MRTVQSLICFYLQQKPKCQITNERELSKNENRHSVSNVEWQYGLLTVFSTPPSVVNVLLTVPLQVTTCTCVWCTIKTKSMLRRILKKFDKKLYFNRLAGSKRLFCKQLYNPATELRFVPFLICSFSLPCVW